MNEKAIAKINSLKLKIYLTLEERLKDGAQRVNYDEIASLCCCSRSAVTFNVGKLFKEGVLGFSDGRLYLTEQSPSSSERPKSAS